MAAECATLRCHAGLRQPDTSPHERGLNNMLYIGIADGMSIARSGGRFEYPHAHARAIGMPSAMPI